MSRVIYVNELSHHGVKGMKWGQRKQRVLVGRRRGSQEQISPEQAKAQRRAKAKKAAIIGGAVVAAGLAVYGAHKYKSLKTEMKQMNVQIKNGQRAVANLYNWDGSYQKSRGALSSLKQERFLGNDFQYHIAGKSIGQLQNPNGPTTRFTNYYADTQKTFDNVRDYARAKKRYTGRY